MCLSSLYVPNYNQYFISVVMHKDKDENGGLHRPRDLTAFDHTPLDGEMFLQVRLNQLIYIHRYCSTIST